MLLQKKALYNLLQLNLPRIESGELKIVDLQEWQIADYRQKTTEELVRQLKGLGIALDIHTFTAIASDFEAPEEMIETLAKERKPLEKDQIFLIVFELWRRQFPEKRTISIFCDELDNQMIAHDLEKPSEIQDALVYLQQLLDEHVDQGMSVTQAFHAIQMFCANDIESFLFDYILNEIEADNHLYAKELLEGFKRYVKDPIWFEYLEARAEILEDPEEGYNHLERVIDEIHAAESALNLAKEILFFLANSGNHSLFYALAKRTLPMLKKEEEFQEFLEACYAHYDYLELKKPALAIARLYRERAGLPGDSPLAQIDPAVMQIRSILDQKLHFAEE